MFNFNGVRRLALIRLDTGRVLRVTEALEFSGIIPKAESLIW